MIGQLYSFELNSVYHEPEETYIKWGMNFVQTRKHCCQCSRKASLGDIIDSEVELKRFINIIEWNDNPTDDPYDIDELYIPNINILNKEK